MPTSRAATPAISDDISGHCGAKFSVALVNILNGTLALISARQVEIDIRPFVALFGKKSLEKQIHAYGIDGGNTERVTNRAVCRRAAPLHQNIPFAAKTNNVPDDQKIAGQIEFFRSGQFAFNLPPRFLIVRRHNASTFLQGALTQE